MKKIFFFTFESQKGFHALTIILYSKNNGENIRLLICRPHIPNNIETPINGIKYKLMSLYSSYKPEVKIKKLSPKIVKNKLYRIFQVDYIQHEIDERYNNW